LAKKLNTQISQQILIWWHKSYWIGTYSRGMEHTAAYITYDLIMNMLHLKRVNFA